MIRVKVVSYRNSTSNHNTCLIPTLQDTVVSYRNSTSNHNRRLMLGAAFLLYLIEILHQTTTPRRRSTRRSRLYLIEILHQTTTPLLLLGVLLCCILSKFYIKPQQNWPSASNYAVVSYRNSTSNHNEGYDEMREFYVVSYRNSTSNHNLSSRMWPPLLVVSYRNSTSNHNHPETGNEPRLLYLIEILHQTTTYFPLVRRPSSCILSKFYIKPQRTSRWYAAHPVVSYRNSTSNHNLLSQMRPPLLVVSYRNSTSNHNGLSMFCPAVRVVSYRNSTSNHNVLTPVIETASVVSYRNSTSNHNILLTLVIVCLVVSYRNSTSNHNSSGIRSYLV